MQNQNQQQKTDITSCADEHPDKPVLKFELPIHKAGYYRVIAADLMTSWVSPVVE